MIKELYQQTVREVSLNVSAGRVDSLRRKNITKSGCRVYDNGYIGVAGCLGLPTAQPPPRSTHSPYPTLSPSPPTAPRADGPHLKQGGLIHRCIS